MKPLLLIFSLFLTVPASAGQILPNLYAQEYCSLRSMGVSKSEAITAAAQHAYVHSLPNVPTVTIDGIQKDVDVVRAARAVSNRCPQYLGE